MRDMVSLSRDCWRFFINKMKCPYCNKPAKWVENKEIYGQNYGKSFMVWLCKPCDAFVGCHNNTKKPKGTMATPDTRSARKDAHSLFDVFWKSGYMSRKKAYKMLNDYFGHEVHIGESDEKKCSEIRDFCLNKMNTILLTK